MLREETLRIARLEWQMKMQHIYACALTLFGADGVKVPAAASVVHAHGVALTLGPWAEGATAALAGLCENERHSQSSFQLVLECNHFCKKKVNFCVNDMHEHAYNQWGTCLSSVIHIIINL